MRRSGVAAIAATALLLQPAAASEVETTHMFGFTGGSDVGDDPEIEKETTARIGKRTGSYSALFETFEARYTPVKNLRVGPTLTFSRHDISSVAGLSNVHQTALQGASFKIKYRLLERQNAPFGLTLVAEPAWNRIDSNSGARVAEYGASFAILVDRALAGDRLYAAFNMLYEAAKSREQGTPEWEREAKVVLAAALTGRLGTGVFAGFEAQYFRKYDALGLHDFAGHALFAGPTFFANLPNRWWISGAWNVQVAGRAAGQSGSSLDLENFTRHRALFRIGVDLD
jgi:hypothetical protein